MTRIATPEMEPKLLDHPDEAALVMKALQAGCSALRKGAKTGETPDPASAEPMKDDSAETRAGRPNRTDALVAVAESFLTHGLGAGTGGDRFEVLVHLDQDTFGPDGQMAVTLEDGTHVSAGTFRRVACDASFVGVVVNGDGSPLDVGRSTRSIPPAIRRALHVRDRGCTFPGCRNQAYLDAHHIESWIDGGETSLQNLTSLCRPHHQLVHEGG